MHRLMSNRLKAAHGLGTRVRAEFEGKKLPVARVWRSGAPSVPPFPHPTRTCTLHRAPHMHAHIQNMLSHPFGAVRPPPHTTYYEHQYHNLFPGTCPHVAATQGSQSRVVRLGSVPGAKAKYLGLVGLGKAAKAGVAAEWGTSSYQVGPVTWFLVPHSAGPGCQCVLARALLPWPPQADARACLRTHERLPVAPRQALGNAVALAAKAHKATSVGLAMLAQPEAALRPAALAQIAAGRSCMGWACIGKEAFHDLPCMTTGGRAAASDARRRPRRVGGGVAWACL